MADQASARVLTVDVGNTVTRFGLFATEPQNKGKGAAPELLGSCAFTTLAPVTADEARVQAAHALELLPACELGGAILSCVVPSVTQAWRTALNALSPTRALVVGPGLKSGVPMRYDDPGEVGADRVANVVAARAAHGSPVVVVDLGTTTNFDVVDTSGAFIGGIIAPGIALGADALAKAAARLPMIELRAPRHAVGKNTREAMQAGVVLGEAARIDGLLDAIAAETDLGDAPVVLTGDGAETVQALLGHETHLDAELTLRGLALLWEANQR